MNNIIRNLSNEEYHFGEQYREYLSSTQLKNYLRSPKAARHAMLSNSKEKSESLKFGSLFHSAMECISRGKSFSDWTSTIAVFEPPINERTSLPYGITTKAYQDAYNVFLEQSKGKEIASETDIEQCSVMVDTLLHECGFVSEHVRSLIADAQEVETSYFYETEEGIKLKVRPDLLTTDTIVDWKTSSLDSLDEESIAKQILKYRYDISLSMYQWVLHKITDVWYEPNLVFVSKSEPCDAVLVDLSDWCYSYDMAYDVPNMGVGALEFSKLLDVHKECIEGNTWRGIESQLGGEIMRPSVPYYLEKKFLIE